MKIILFIVLAIFCASALLTLGAYLSMLFMEWLFFKIFYENDEDDHYRHTKDKE